MPLDILVIGGGSIGERHVRCFQAIGCTVALCDSSPEQLAEMADKYHLARTFRDLQQATSDTWYGVVIATPANLHAGHAVAISNSTVALLIEKPLCTRLEDAAWLQPMMKNKVVQVGYVLRYHPATQHVRQLLEENVIGALHQVTVTAGQNFASLRPAYRGTYYRFHETGGGAVQDAATHLFDLVQYLAGPLDWVFADCAHQEVADVEVEDTIHLIGRAGGGRVLVSIALNQFMAPNETHVQLNGAKGSLAIRFHEHRAGMLMLGDSDWTWTEPLASERDDLFREQAQSFLAAAIGQEPPRCGLDDGIRALRVNLAALQSCQTRAAVTI